MAQSSWHFGDDDVSDSRSCTSFHISTLQSISLWKAKQRRMCLYLQLPWWYFAWKMTLVFAFSWVTVVLDYFRSCFLITPSRVSQKQVLSHVTYIVFPPSFSRMLDFFHRLTMKLFRLTSISGQKTSPLLDRVTRNNVSETSAPMVEL